MTILWFVSGDRHCSIARAFAGAIVAAALLCGPAEAGAEWVETFSFDPTGLSVVDVRGFDEISLKGCVVDAPEGAPRLPVYLAMFSVPEGEKVVGVEVVEVRSESLAGRYDVLPSGGETPDTPITRDTEIWSAMSPYPAEVATLGGSGFMRGAGLASVVLHPVQLIPFEGTLLFNREITIRIRTAPSTERGLRSTRSSEILPPVFESIRLGRGGRVESESVDMLAGKRSGSAESGLFQPTEYPSLDGSLVEYLIVADDDLASEFQRLADWKTASGVPAAVKTISWIEANYAGGVDLQEKIRMFIQDAYQKWGTVWILLAGDNGTIPSRLAHIDYYAPGDWLIATDMYYECLDGNWNGDGDHLFGEGYKTVLDVGDSADFFPDVFVGRASVEDLTEAAAFIDNALAYRKSPSLSGYLTSTLFLGEVVFPIGWDPGDPVYLDGGVICDQSAQWVPSTWDTVKLYEINGNENHDSILNEMNAGYGIVGVVNHGDAFKMSCSDDSYLYITDMDSLQNFGELGFVYASNCNLSQIEMDCFNEHLMQNLNRGYIGAIGSTRFCFPHVARDFQEEVYRLIFATGVDRQGAVHGLHKIPFAATSAIDNSAHRWTTLSYMLLGDPELAIWTDVPQALNVTHAGSMTLGDSTYAVSVTSGGQPAVGLTVCMWKQDTGEYARGLTDGSGQIDLPFEPGSPGSVSLVVIGDNCLPHEATVTVSGTGRVYVSEVVVDDAAFGNGDGEWDTGEQVDVDVTLHNGTTLAVENVTGALGLVDGGSVTVDLTFNGAADPQRLFVGQESVHPISLPAIYEISEDVLLGRPRYTGCAPSDSGVYFWLDRSGWHVRAVGGFGDHDVWVRVSTDGRALDVESVDTEAADSLWIGTQEFQLFADLDASDCEDGATVVFGDTAGVAVLDGSASFGTIGADLSQTDSFTLSSVPDIADGVPVWLVLDISSGGETWTEWIRLDLRAPVLSEYYHGIDDSTYTGNGNGQAEVGETVVLYSAILNRGSGAASGVVGVMRGVAGVDVTDSTDAIGTVQGGAVVHSADGYVFTCLSPSMSVSVELTDAEGRRWSKTFGLMPPSAPSNLEAFPAPKWIDLQWAPPSEEDVIGYNVYRMDAGRSPFQRVTTLLDEGSAIHRDYGLLPERHYVYEVTAVDSSGNESARSGALDAWSAAPYQTGFPVSSKNQFFSSPVIGDIDLDNDLEIVIGSKDGYVYAWHHTGDPVSGWPRDTGGEVWSAPSLANLDEDPELEVLSGTWNNAIYAWNHDGTGVLSPDGVFATTTNRVRSSPVCQDVDFDGKVEIFAGSSSSRLYAWNHDGTAYLPSGEIFAVLGGGEVAASPAIGNVDDEMFYEIFAASLNGNLYAWNHDGTAYLDTMVFAKVGAGMWSSPAIGDIDNNGDLEIAIGAFNDSVYVWNHDGSLFTGWPRKTGHEIWSSPALGDMDGDGDLEIVIGSYDHWVYAWHHDGTGVANANGRLGETGDDIWGSPALADLNQDGLLDVVIGSTDGYLYVWDSSGNLLPGWPIHTWDGIYGSPAVGDLDNDSDLEVIIASYDAMLYAFDVSATVDPGTMDWPMFHHDAHRTGYYGFEGLLDAEEDEILHVVAAGLEQNYPNPFNPETAIAYRLSAPADVDLAVYDVAGRRVRTLASGRQIAGVHTVAWRGDNAYGGPVASGVYFYRLRVSGEVFSKKMVLLK